MSIVPFNVNKPFGDYIVFVDESGDQSLTSIDSQYPIFVLSFCIFNKKHYVDYVVPELLRLKFDYFGSTIPILHEREMRKRENDFSFLMEVTLRNAFMERLNTIITDSQFTIITTIIDKNYYSQYHNPTNPYTIGMQYGIERVCFYLSRHRQREKITPIIFESRGLKEDSKLKEAFEDFANTSSVNGLDSMFDFQCVKKSANIQGLQLADLVARPIGTHYLHPDSNNRAWDILKNKLDRSPSGVIDGYGIKVYPKEDPNPFNVFGVM